jgi:DNA-binding transcriptional MerR regulator
MSTAKGLKISELSLKTEIPLATIKFYLREGLLPPGERTGPNQARYGPEHLSRLRLIRTMRDIGGLSIATIREILRHTDDAPDPSILAQVADAIADHPGPVIASSLTEGPGRGRAEEDVAAVLSRAGWDILPDSRVRARLVDALMAIRATVEPDVPAEVLDFYAHAAFDIARNERRQGMSHLEGGTDGIVEAVVRGTILWEMVLTTMRRLAHEHLGDSGAYDDWLATWRRGLDGADVSVR